MYTTLGNEIKVRRRHRWVAVMYLPLTEDEAQRLATEGEGSMAKSGVSEVSFDGPVCDECLQRLAERSYSCPGDPSRA